MMTELLERPDEPTLFRTHLPGRDGEAPAGAKPPQTRRNLSSLHHDDVIRLVGALLAGICTTAWLFTQVMPLRGAVGFVAIAFVLFLLYYVVLVVMDDGGPAMKDKVASVFAHAVAMLLFAALACVIVFTFARAADALVHASFWTTDLSAAGPIDPLDQGGILHAMLGTLIQISIALAISIPLGVLTAVFLSEVPGPFARVVRTIVEAMTALPSIVAGLFIYATWIVTFGMGQSGFAASLAITIMMLPIIVRAADVVLRLVPGNLKEAALAMGASQWRTVWHVTLPTTRSGLTTAVILGTARGIGETSPVLLTAGYTTYLNANPFEGPMVSLPLATFNLVKSPEANQIARGFGAAAVLMLLVLILFIVARVIGGRGPGQLSRRQAARRTRQSRADAVRFAERDGEFVLTYEAVQRARRGRASAGRRSRKQRS
jgi:phosphate transport system permease protein